MTWRTRPLRLVMAYGVELATWLPSLVVFVAYPVALISGAAVVFLDDVAEELRR